MNVDDLTAQLRDLGIRQEGDPVLRQECEPFDLPRERAEATALWERSAATSTGSSRSTRSPKAWASPRRRSASPGAMSIMRPPNGAADIALINSTVPWQSEEQDEKYEGCLSFFDVRVPVPRPLAIRVQLSTFDGQRVEHSFDRGLARLVLHEIDHLRGTLARDLVRPGAKLIPLSEYAEGSREWEY